MKKIYAFFAAALMSASLYAAAPTAADLAAEYDVVNNVVFCIEFIEDAVVCNDIRFVGTPNKWGKGADADDSAPEAWDNCEKFAPVPGFDGWYAAELPYSEGFQGKPLQEPTDRSWTWDYQCGDMDAWVHVDGNELEISAGYADECNIKANAAGAYIYQLKYWKKHKSPCEVVVKHTYTVKVYAPDACSEMKPGIIGDFNGWKEGVPMSEGLDDDFETVYSYTFEDQEGHGFKIKEATDTDWSNEMQYLDEEAGEWKKFDNYELGAEELIVLNWGDNSKFRFAQCSGSAAEVVVSVKVPAGAPAAGVEVIGTFDGWSGTAMELKDGLWVATITVVPADEFKFREAGTWDNEIEVLGEPDEENPEGKWSGLPNMVVEKFVKDGKIELDFSDAAQYRWKVPSQEGIENVVLTEKAQKVVVDGVMYIVRDNKMFDVNGTQVR
jgi:hypothetical protein